MSGHSNLPSSVAHAISGILGMYGACSQIDISHIKRQGNKPAHLLTKYALGIDDYMTWMEEHPCFLQEALFHDESCIT